MAIVKTQIWRGGLPGLTPEQKPTAEPAPEASTPVCVGAASLAGEEPPSGLAQPMLSAAPAVQTEATRIMPMEALLGLPVPGSEPQPTPFLRLLRTKYRRPLLYGILGLFIVVPWLLPAPPEEASAALRARVTAPESAVAPAGQAPAAAPQLADGTPTQDETAARSAPLTAAGEGPTERQAVDALAGGDDARAARLYAQLAARHPDNEALREAARIMAERAAADR